MNKLTAIMRSKTDKLANIRSNGMIPAVVYGARVENTTISVPSIDFQKIFKITGETSTISLEIKDGKKVDVLVHEIQFDPLKGFPIHIDFLAVDMNKPVEVTIPLEFVGVSEAEKNGLGVLVKVLHEIDVESLPKDIPQKLEVDLSSLKELDSQIHVKDIKIPSGVKVLTEGEEVVALITEAKEEKLEEGPVDISSVEIEKKGKKEEEA